MRPIERCIFSGMLHRFWYHVLHLLTTFG